MYDIFSTYTRVTGSVSIHKLRTLYCILQSGIVERFGPTKMRIAARPSFRGAMPLRIGGPERIGWLDKKTSLTACTRLVAVGRSSSYRISSVFIETKLKSDLPPPTRSSFADSVSSLSSVSSFSTKNIMFLIFIISLQT